MLCKKFKKIKKKKKNIGKIIFTCISYIFLFFQIISYIFLRKIRNLLRTIVVMIFLFRVKFEADLEIKNKRVRHKNCNACNFKRSYVMHV